MCLQCRIQQVSQAPLLARASPEGGLFCGEDAGRTVGLAVISEGSALLATQHEDIGEAE